MAEYPEGAGTVGCQLMKTGLFSQNSEIIIIYNLHTKR